MHIYKVTHTDSDGDTHVEYVEAGDDFEANDKGQEALGRWHPIHTIEDITEPYLEAQLLARINELQAAIEKAEIEKEAEERHLRLYGSKATPLYIEEAIKKATQS